MYFSFSDKLYLKTLNPKITILKALALVFKTVLVMNLREFIHFLVSKHPCSSRASFSVH